MRVMNDGFVYKLVEGSTAKDIFFTGIFELYVLHDDDSESLIEEYKDLRYAIDEDMQIGIAVGNINNIEKNESNKN